MKRSATYLTGFMGAGKTTVGKVLAETMECAFIDLDLEVERSAGCTVAEIFSSQGEGAFRRLELAALEATGLGRRQVVATGGGTMCFEAMREVMAARGVTVWLDAPFETVAARVRAGSGGSGTSGAVDARPLFVDEERARELWKSRRKHYEQSDIRLQIRGDEPVGELAAKIAGRLEEVH